MNSMTKVYARASWRHAYIGRLTAAAYNSSVKLPPRFLFSVCINILVYKTFFLDKEILREFSNNADSDSSREFDVS